MSDDQRICEVHPYPFVPLSVSAEAGIHGGLRALLAARRKKDAEKAVNGLVFTAGDLARLIYNCGELGLTHRTRFKRHVSPNDLLSASDSAAMHADSAPHAAVKAWAKVARQFRDGKRVKVHLFESPDAWHCFYYSQDDADESEGNHWEYGRHLHYLSHLWTGRLTREDVWNAFDQRHTSLPSVHIRFSPRFPFGLTREEELKFLEAR
jgi:hypothetical protein